MLHRFGIALAATLLVAACQSSASLAPTSSSSPTPPAGTSTAPSPSPATAANSPAPSASGPAPSASVPAATPAGSAPVLTANLCDMLAPGTIRSITGLNVGPGKLIAGDSNATGSCLWSATTTLGVEITGYTEARIQAKIGANLPGFTSVPGLGQGAKGAVGLLPSTTIKVASLLIDFGTYGLLLALNSPTASVDQDVQLAHALK